jgi:DNA-binding XRE family transcriptional regulator
MQMSDLSINETFSSIRDRRIRLGMSQGQLAQAAKVTRPTISNIERGAHFPTKQTYVKIIDTLNQLETISAA